MLLRYLHSSASCFPNSRLEHAVIELPRSGLCSAHHFASPATSRSYKQLKFEPIDKDNLNHFNPPSPGPRIPSIRADTYRAIPQSEPPDRGNAPSSLPHRPPCNAC